MARVEVITGPIRRRRWSEEQKRAIVAEGLAPGATVSEVARRADIFPGQVYRWRQELRTAAEGFAPVLMAPEELGLLPPPDDGVRRAGGRGRVRRQETGPDTEFGFGGIGVGGQPEIIIIRSGREYRPRQAEATWLARKHLGLFAYISLSTYSVSGASPRRSW
jgi:transposase